MPASFWRIKMSKPPFVISMYASKETLYKAKAEYYEQKALQLGLWIEEALSYVGCTTWSPSLQEEGVKLLEEYSGGSS